MAESARRRGQRQRHSRGRTGQHPACEPQLLTSLGLHPEQPVDGLENTAEVSLRMLPQSGSSQAFHGLPGFNRCHRRQNSFQGGRVSKGGGTSQETGGEWNSAPASPAAEIGETKGTPQTPSCQAGTRGHSLPLSPDIRLLHPQTQPATKLHQYSLLEVVLSSASFHPHRHGPFQGSTVSVCLENHGLKQDSELHANQSLWGNPEI